MGIQNNTARFDKLIWPHMATILRTAQVLSRNAAEAEDLTQDTMVKAFKSLDSLRADSCVRAWLLTILRRAHIDAARSTHVSTRSLEAMNLDPAAQIESGRTDGEATWDQPDDVLETFSDHQILLALKELPKEIRWTLLLVDVEGLDQRDASEVLGIPVGTVKSRLGRGRAMLHAVLQPGARADTNFAQFSVVV